METAEINKSTGTACSYIPVRSPDLLLRQVGEGYAYVVNCSFLNSFRLFNQKQYEILQSVNGTDDVKSIADKFGMEIGPLGQFFDMLRKTEIVRFDHRFSAPQKPVTPNALNFWVHTTNACNLGCSYCYISTLNTSGGMEKKVQQQLLHKIIDAAKTDGIRHIRLRLAGGEPLGQFCVWKEFIIKAKQSLAPLGCRLDTGFVTNLTMLNDDMIAFAKEIPYRFWRITGRTRKVA
ncbi:4Fe-4S cluster-binding domain-containing protein [Agrobacterium tumefaciens]|nr:4Fe-4S cluster-binding domain-containing protein [Agrobacterium tumefaciens]NTE21937.1 4Fe-4S cluster-binding domain-containing protein [Agrobacterium tumefaciens]